MKTNAFAMASLLAAAGTATVALGQWTLPMALGSVTVDQDKNLTIDFDNAPVTQVFESLKKAGINFVVETTDIPKSKRLTVHIKGQSRDKAVEAIAEALGMAWSKKGSIYTLHRGFDSSFKMSLDGKTFNWTPQEAEKWSQEFGSNFGSDWNAKMLDEKAWQDKAKEWEKGWKSKGMDEKAMEEWAKHWDKSSGKFEWKELPPGTKFELKDMPDVEKLLHDRMTELHGKEMKLKDMPEVEKLLHDRMTELHGQEMKLKDMPDVEKLLKERMTELHGKEMQLKDMPDVEKLLKERMTELHGKEMALKDMPEVEKLMKEHLKAMPKLDESAMKARLEALKELKDFKMPDMSALKLKLENLHKLVDSLTPAQLEKNKTQGYLTLDDLTPKQRDLLGDMSKGDGDMSVQFDKDGTRVTIKRK